MYLLLDTSGTYRGELRKAEDVILYTLSRLEPADSFAVARIDTGSFSEKDIIAKATFDERPSTANQQKRAFAQKVQDFVARENASQYTDITGGLLQAVEFLNEKGTGRKTILIFSDLEQDLEQGLHSRHRGAVQGLRRGGAECRQAAQGQLRPAPIPGAARALEGSSGESRRTLARGERPRSPRQHAVRCGGSRAQITAYQARIWRARIRPASWRRRIVFYWLARDGGGMSFFAMLAVPIIALTSIVAFAYSGRSRDEPAAWSQSTGARSSCGAWQKTSTSRLAGSP